MFCPKCGAILLPKKDGKKTIMKCSCGYVEKIVDSDSSIKLKEEVKGEDKKIEIVKDEDESLPLTDAVCPECKHSKAYYWLIQTRAGDEPETRFYKCEKCKHTWREY